MELLPDHLNRRLLDACNLLTQVGDELQADLNRAVLQGISPERAGEVIRLAVQVETLNQLAAQAFAIRSARPVVASHGARPEAACDG